MDRHKQELIDAALGVLEQHGISHTDISSHIQHLTKQKQASSFSALVFPVSILVTKELSSLEAIVKYLRENVSLSNTAVANLLSRDPRTTWQTYQQAKKKRPGRFAGDFDGDETLTIPYSAIADRSLSVLESIIIYLSGHYRLRNVDIARRLRLDARTTWTVMRRAQKKQGGGERA